MNFDVLYPPEKIISNSMLNRDFPIIKRIVEGEYSHENIDDCISWANTRQGYDFWRAFYLGENQEEGMQILREVVGIASYNEEDIWE